MIKARIIEEFIAKKKSYNSFRDRLLNLLHDLVNAENLIVHQIAGRTKTVNSLSLKIDRKHNKYHSIRQITDIVGIRIITYLESDVDIIANIIRQEFEIDDVNSIDKRMLKTDQFGYRSLHLVISLNSTRRFLKEFEQYQDFKCEIQIRSVLQHAWAEIEHDLGYKGVNTIPEPYKRTFNRLSALLEMADIEFDRLKQELKSYEKQIDDLITLTPEDVDINQASIESLLLTNEVLKAADMIIISKSGFPHVVIEIGDYLYEAIKLHQFYYVNTLESALQTHKEKYFVFLNTLMDYEILKSPRAHTAPLTFFLHYLTILKNDDDFHLKYVNLPGWRHSVILKLIGQAYKNI